MITSGASLSSPSGAGSRPEDCRDRERALLLLCCSPDQSSGCRTKIDTLLADGIDWPRFGRLATKNSVAPLAAARLLANSRTQLPRSIARQYALLAESTAMRCDYLATSLFEILDAFKRERIPALTIKGLMTAAAAYHDISLRAFGDLDLVVRRDDVARAMAALERIGFTGKAWRAEAFASGFFPDTSVDCSRDSTVVDLHWSLSADYFPFAPDDGTVWRRAIESDLRGRPVMTMGNEDSILFHAYHGAKHGWSKLQQVCDLAYLCALKTPRWNDLLAGAARIGSRTMVLVGVELRRSLFGIEAPEPLTDALGEPRIKSLSKKVEARMFETREEGEFSEWRMALASIDSRRGRVRYLATRLVSPRLSDCALLPLPRPLYPLYYVARPALLAIKHREAWLKRGGSASRAAIISR